MTIRQCAAGFLLTTSVFTGSFHLPTNEKAAAPPVGISITTNPRIELSGDPGQTLSGKIAVQNSGASVADISTIINDVLTGDLEGRPRFLPEGTSSHGFSLASWTTATPERTILNPNQTLQFDYEIKIPKNAAPGGHYGAIGFSINSNTQATSPIINAIPRVYALVLLTVSGKATYGAQIASISVKHSNKAPSDSRGQSPKPGYIVNSIVKNTGNIHFRPKDARVEIKNTFGKQLLIIPMDANLDKNVLPNSKREFTSSFFRHLGVGIYSARVTFSIGPDGGAQQEITKTVRFYVGPPWWVWVLVGVAFLLIVIAIFSRRRLRAAIHAFRSGSPKHAGGA